jgi:hypothetical protein
VVTMKVEKTVLRLNIKKTGSGTYYVPSLSMKNLKMLNEKHKCCHFPRKWRLALDGSALVLE